MPQEVDRQEQRKVMDRFLAALTTGDVQGLMDVLAPDVVLVADSGGFATAVRHPLVGAERVVALLAKFSAFADQLEVSTIWLNGAPRAPDRRPAEARHDGGQPGRGRRQGLTRVYSMRNPHKLGRLEAPVAVSR